ncbi:MAG: RNA 2',3'-cyclic phosphodiesterase, partial [Nitrospinaceae bacterium]|nr:RNA 2',3'-cyclic phosphodiesterase [Nitrospinaceae bacterium]
TSPDRIPEIKERMRSATAGRAPFSIPLGRLGAFPNAHRPRVLWVGLDDPEGHLLALQQSVEAQMVEMGFPPETKKSVPHLTLGRIKSPQGMGRLRKELEKNRSLDVDPVHVTAMELIQSELTPAGSIYTVLEEFSLHPSPQGD